MSWSDTTLAPNVRAAAMLSPGDSHGSDEQMFGTKQQVPHGSEPTKERFGQRTRYPTIRFDVA